MRNPDQRRHHPPPGWPEEGDHRYASPLSEGAQVPHSNWGHMDHGDDTRDVPVGTPLARHQIAGDRWRGRDDAYGQGRRDLGDDYHSGDESGQPRGSDPGRGHHSGTGGEARSYDWGANSGHYEGTGFNRGYGIEVDHERRNAYRDATGGHFGDIDDYEDLYGEGRGARPTRRRAAEARAGRTPRTLPKGYQRSDERLREDVCERLSHSGLDVSDVSVNVAEGEVTLEGNVRNRQTKHAIENCADDCLGVKDVHNHLRVVRQASKATGEKEQSGDRD